MTMANLQKLNPTQQELYNYLEQQTGQVNFEVLQPFTTQEMGTVLHISRNTVSQYLNEFFKEGWMVKINTRPVYYFLRETLSRKFNVQTLDAEYEDLQFLQQDLNHGRRADSCFAGVIGYHLSLKSAVEKCRVAVEYPPTGLPLVLEDVNITIGEGEFVAVLGHNGSGKSTFAKHCNAVLLPRTGTVTVDGMNTKDEDKLFEIRQCAGMVFQNPDNQIVATVVEEDVAFAPENMGVEPAEIRRRVDEALKAVGMYEYRESAPHQLSGGQKQRVAIAGIIAMQPRCILLDEPTAMLDPRGRQEVMRVLRQLNREKGITVVLITHYMEEAAACDRVIVMDDGHVLMDDVPRKVFSHVAELRQGGLDVPQTTELMTILKEAGLPVQADIIDEQECIEALEALLTR